ncbi:MAG: response regulator transcription factor [Chloroflexi bacterium]|nr:response regulator transcription factor [Chloroflexota bacterium]
MMTETIKVLIADDHPVVRNGLRLAVTDTPGMTLVGEARDGLEAEEMALEVKPDVILMDISMPRRGGFETMLSIKKKLTEVKILMLTVSEQNEDLLQAVRLGADGYLLKTVPIGQIIDAIRQVAAGEAILSPEMTAKLMGELKKKATEPSLSAREEEVLGLLGEGLTTIEIASRLYLGQGTVSTYARRLLDKLHLKNRAEAIAYAAQRRPNKA